jgi:hypothetical protein
VHGLTSILDDPDLAFVRKVGQNMRGGQDAAHLADRDERSGASTYRVLHAVEDLEFGEPDRIGCHGVADGGGRDGYRARHRRFPSWV